jgi:hypothetical protein
MIGTIPVLGIVVMAICCGTLAFWCACVPVCVILPRLRKTPGIHRVSVRVIVLMFVLTGFVALAGPCYVYDALGGLPNWGKVEGDRYFLGKANGRGYVEVSKAVYWYSHWLLIASGGSLMALFVSALTISALNGCAQRKAIAKQLDELCLRDDLKSLYELIDCIDEFPRVASPVDKNRLRLYEEIHRRTAHIHVLKPPLSVAPLDVLRQQKEMWNGFVQEHENEIARRSDNTAIESNDSGGESPGTGGPP